MKFSIWKLGDEYILALGSDSPGVYAGAVLVKTVGTPTWEEAFKEYLRYIEDSKLSFSFDVSGNGGF